MNYALNHELVTGQKLPTIEKKKKKKSNFFGTRFGFTNLFLPKTLIFPNFNLTQKSECSKQQILCSITRQLNDHQAIL